MSHSLSDLIETALAERDAAADVCPVNRPNWSGGKKPCPLCRATARDTCHRLAGADHSFVEQVRAALKARATDTEKDETDV